VGSLLTLVALRVLLAKPRWADLYHICHRLWLVHVARDTTVKCGYDMWQLEALRFGVASRIRDVLTDPSSTWYNGGKTYDNSKTTRAMGSATNSSFCLSNSAVHT